MSPAATLPEGDLSSKGSITDNVKSSARRPRYRSTTLAEICYERLKKYCYRDALPLPILPPRGLINAGNTCFVNVVLQALLSCAPFRRLLFAVKDVLSLPPLLSKFVRLAVDMHENGKCMPLSAKGRTFSLAEPLRPEWFDNVFPDLQNDSGKSCSLPNGPAARNPLLLRTGQGSQEDAEEFLTFVLNKLHEELMANYEDLIDGKCELPGNASLLGRNEHDGEGSHPTGNGILHLAPDNVVDSDDRTAKHSGMNGTTMNGGFGSPSYHGLATSEEGSESDTPNVYTNGPRNETTRIESHFDSVHCNMANGVTASASNANTTALSAADTELGSCDSGGVWEEMTRKGKTVEVRNAALARSPITDIFGGVLRSELKRPNVKLSVTREPFFSLSLDIESGLVRDVEQSLTAYFEPERLEGYTLESSSEAIEARKHVLLEALPQILVLHLKRFSHNIQTGALTKVHRRMDFPEYLEIPNALLSSAKIAPSAIDRTYVLTAVVTHIGKELAGGHYTCDVRRETNNEVGPKWITCDDSKISPVTLESVQRKQAYLLFYSRGERHSTHSRVPR